jgi:hypothetical protein
MAGELTRQEARSKFDDLCRQVRDKYLPEDLGKGVAEGKFWEWEDQADALDRELTGAFLEILGQLSGGAKLEDPGSCPFCQSVHVRWLDPAGQRERRSKHGAVVLPRQVAQCRSCDRSFSPSGAGVGSGRAGGPDPAGVGQGMPGVGDDAVV